MDVIIFCMTICREHYKHFLKHFIETFLGVNQKGKICVCSLMDVIIFFMTICREHFINILLKPFWEGMKKEKYD
jgi:hypothetical protein